MNENLATGNRHERRAAAATERKGVLIPAREVRRRCGNVSDMTLHRWLKQTDFPRPKVINGQRYWVDTVIDAYIEELPEG